MTASLKCVIMAIKNGLEFEEETDISKVGKTTHMN